MVMGSVIKGRTDMRKQVVLAIIVRQRREYRRLDGTMIKFEDNAAVVLKDDKGNPKGTMFKGAIAKEVCERWPAVAKLAKIIV
jgi:large subunit ribosomal protein L14